MPRIGRIILGLAWLSAGPAALAQSGTAPCRDWPEWRGPLSSGAASAGWQLVESLDKARLAWTSDPVGLSGCGHGSPDHLATGFCDPVIVGGRVYLFWFERSGQAQVQWERIEHSKSFGMRLIDQAYRDANEVAAQKEFNADDVFVCLDAATGRTIWKRCFHQRGFNHRKVYSPLCVPCVRDGRLYGLGSAGSVYCLDAATGKPLWQSDVGKAAEQFEQMREMCRRSGARGVEPAGFNHGVTVAEGVVVVGDSGSPLGGRGSNPRRGEAGLVGLDGRTGRRLWHVPDCLHRWGTPARWRHDGREYILAAGRQRMVAVEPRTGKVLWELPGQISDSVTLAVSGDHVVVNTNKTKDPTGDGPTCYSIDLNGARKLWTLPPAGDLFICHVGAVIMGPHAYVRTSAGLACVELATGKLLGTTGPFGHAYSGYVGGDGLLFDMRLRACRAYPDFKMLDGQLPGSPQFGFIQSPAYADGRVYLRGRTNIYCYDFRKDAQPTPAAPRNGRDEARPSTATALAEKVQSSDWLARVAAAEMLRATGPKATLAAAPVLRRLLAAAIAARDWGDTELLLETLLAVDRPSAAAAAGDLARLLDAQDYSSTMLACHGLAMLGPDAAPAVASLAKLLKAEPADLAVAAARTLCAIGPKAAATAPKLLALLDAQDEELSYHALKALLHVGPPKQALGDLIDRAVRHPWVGNKADHCVLPRYTSYAVCLLSLLGRDDVPLLLSKARQLLDSRANFRGLPSGDVVADYMSALEIMEAAYVIDPGALKAAQAVVEATIAGTKGRNLGEAGGRLKLLQMELAGSIDIRDPWGYAKMQAESAARKARELKELKKNAPTRPPATNVLE